MPESHSIDASSPAHGPPPYAEVVDSVPALMWMTDPEGRCSWVNRGWLQFSGTTLEQNLGDGWTRALHPADSQHCIEISTVAMRAGKGFALECRFRRHDGVWRWFMDSAQPVVDEKGVLLGHAGACVDITERREAEQAMAAARAKADAAATAKAEFLATMSHEIRTPLNGMLGLTELLLDSALDVQQRRDAETLSASAASLVALLNDLLDVSRLDAGRLSLEQRSFDLRRMVTEVTDLFVPTALRVGTDLEAELPEDLPCRVRGDELRLRQVVGNLIGNAVKFTQRGSVRVSVAIEERSATRVRVRMAVRDTGVGMTATAAARVFERYTQAEASTARCFGGTGLGLSICKQLVEAMGSSIHVESEPGQGSSFSFVLDLGLGLDDEGGQASADAVSAATTEPALDTVAVAAGVAALAGVRVLLADDNTVNVMVARRFLDRFGCRTDVAHDGEGALLLARQGYYDIMLLDVHMPVMDGLAAAAAVRALEGHPSATTPIVALTASALPVEHAACRRAGMDDILVKPFRSAELAAVLCSCLAAGRAASAAGAARED